MTGFVEGHQPDKISCISCHLGDNTSFIKEAAHKNMLTIPGNLSNATQTCAQCHPGIDSRVKNSIMNTMSGIISIDKYVFNENNELDKLFSVYQLSDSTAADHHLRNKCASCHLGNEKTSPGPISETSRGGGCTACHLNYTPSALKDYEQYITSDKKILPKIHPSLSLNISNNHCFGCHSRSGRISTNYEGWHETQLKAEEITDFANYRVLEDQRVFEKKTSDVHHDYGLSCIDCHDAEDVMGDGILYAHKEDAVHTDCRDCHSNNYSTIDFEDLSTSNQAIIRMRHLDTTAQFIFSNSSNKALINVMVEGEQLFLATKKGTKKLRLSPTPSICTKAVHKNVSCSACHTEWAPQCISCHTSYDETEDGYDLLDKKWVIGDWKEEGDHFLATIPTLGVIEKEGGKTIKTFSPGMVLSLDKKGDSQSHFQRFFAPASAHTISKKGRNCKDCHLNPLVLGYGRGELKFNKNKQWTFYPAFENAPDGLPKDAWIPFLSNNSKYKATRSNARPFNLQEQKNILKVGLCLRCHEDNSAVSLLILDDFEGAVLGMGGHCEDW